MEYDIENVAECPVCGYVINGNYEEGEIINCSDCGSELEVIDINPLVLEEAPEEEEDWGE